MVVGLGEVLWDDFGTYRTLGGAVTNFAVHSAQLGLESWIVGAIGHDDDGRAAARELQSRGVMTHLSRVDFPTGLVSVSSGEDSLSKYDIKYPSAWDFIPFTDELVTLARKADAVCFGTLAQRNPTSRETICRFIEEMPSGSQALKVFDANLRQNFWNEPVIRSSMSLCNVLKISDNEYEVMRDIFGLDKDPLTGCRQLMKGFKLMIVILTCGATGSYVLSQFGESSLPALPYCSEGAVSAGAGASSGEASESSGASSGEASDGSWIADTVGAGDAFTAGFISSILGGHNVCEAHGFAARLASYVCSKPGATPSLDGFRG